MKQVLISLCLLALIGCADQRNRQDVVQASPEFPWKGLKPGTSGSELSQPPASVKLDDITASNNATQQSLTGFGVQISKLAESFKLFGDSLAHVEATATANVKATADVSAELRNTLDARLNVQAKAFSDWQVQFEQRMQAQFTAQGAGVAALKSDLQQMSITVSAGRDSNVQTIQFSREMRDTLIQSFENQLDTTKAFCALIVSLMGILQITDRLRAKNDHKEFMKALSLLSKGEDKNE